MLSLSGRSHSFAEGRGVMALGAGGGGTISVVLCLVPQDAKIKAHTNMLTPKRINRLLNIRNVVYEAYLTAEYRDATVGTRAFTPRFDLFEGVGINDLIIFDT